MSQDNTTPSNGTNTSFAYCRILVNQGDTKLFRTSRIVGVQQMLNLLARIRAGFPAAEGYDVQVLGVSYNEDEPGKLGEILTADTLSLLAVAQQLPAIAFNPDTGTN